MENLAAARARLAAEPPAPLQGYDAALQEAQDEGLIAVSKAGGLTAIEPATTPSTTH